MAALPGMNRRTAGALVLLTGLMGCGGDGPMNPDVLPSIPVPVSPIGGTQVATDSPSFVVRNAQGYDAGQAQYTFRVTTASATREIARITVPAGNGTTTTSFASALPRGMLLRWDVTAASATASVTSTAETFRLPAIACERTSDAYAKTVIDSFLPICPRLPNIYNDPQELLGPPDVGGVGPNNYVGFVSLGEGGYVTADMQACAVDEPGPDLRVYQAQGTEEVTLLVSGSPTGPFMLLEARKPCGDRVPGRPPIERYCEFDLASAEVQEARYLRVQDGELYPCALAGTVSEGADIDALQILHLKP